MPAGRQSFVGADPGLKMPAGAVFTVANYLTGRLNVERSYAGELRLMSYSFCLMLGARVALPAPGAADG
jgi:hypothetical protein